MRVLVTGDRNWHSADLAERILNRLLARYGPTLIIVHGGATGIDRAFAEAAEHLGIEQEAHPADWDEHGKRAGPLRNQAMVDAGADLCLACHRAITASKGTKDCVRRAMAAGIPTYLIDSERGEPKRLRGDDERLK
jgi:hypothetical protein